MTIKIKKRSYIQNNILKQILKETTIYIFFLHIFTYIFLLAGRFIIPTDGRKTTYLRTYRNFELTNFLT